MNDRILSIIVKAQDQASKTITGIGDAAAKVGDAFIKMTKVALLAGAAAAAAFSVSAVKNAIDLGESINAVSQVFDDATSKIIDFGKTAAEQAGLSRAAFNTAVTPIGALLRNVGFSADEAADSSINLGKRAADLASVFNTDLNEALTAIQAGLRGEADPLERFGVGLNEASVQAYAVKKGISAAGAEMTAAQKTTARLGLLFEQTDRFAGDFVNTADQAANKARILSARFENQSAIIGAKLLPAWELLLNTGDTLITNIFPVIESAIDTISAAFNNALPAIQNVAAQIGDYLGPKFEDLARVVSEDLLPVLKDLYENVLKPIGFVLGVTIVLAIGLVVDVLKTLVSWATTAYNAIKDGLGRLKETLQPGIDWFIQNVWPMLQLIGQWIGNEFTKAWNDLQKAIQDINKSLKDSGINIDVVQLALGALVGIVIAAAVPLLALTATVVGLGLALVRIVAFVAEVIAALQRFAYEAGAKLGVFIHDFTAGLIWLRDNVGNVFSTMASMITAPFRAAFNGIVTAWNNTIGRLSFTFPSWVPDVGGKGISAPKLSHFASGGIVGGNPSSGDNTLVATTPGEMILNKSQQGKLFSMIAGGNGAQAQPVVINVYGDINGEGAIDRFAERVNAVLNTGKELGEYGVGL